MAQFPPGFPRFSLPPPWFSFNPSPRLPPPPSSYEPPPPSNDSSREKVAVGIVLGFLAFVLLYVIVCSSCRVCRNSRARAAAAEAAAGPQPLEETSSVRLDERPLRHAHAASPTTGLPVFSYTLSVRRNVMGAADEVAMCSVCLGALQLGETVRLLPVCLHLYHAECIDTWLEAHSTCPLCRSETDLTTGAGRV